MKTMKRTIFCFYILFCLVLIVLFLYIFIFERPYIHRISPDVKFGFLPADNADYYREFKALGIDYVLISNYSEDDVVKRLSEAEQNGLAVYISAGTLHPDDFKRMEEFGGSRVVEGFFLDEPHLHKIYYTNSDIKKWIQWSKEKFPGKKIFIATPKNETYKELLDIVDPKEVGFQPDSYPIMGLFTGYGTQRRLIEKMKSDGFEVQPIIQGHALSLYEEKTRRRYIDFFARIGGYGLIDWPTPTQVAIQIKNVAKDGVKIIWFYPGEDEYVKWTRERKEYIKNIFDELKK